MGKILNFHTQVSELVKQYKREHLTVWGNANSEIVDKCYKEVSCGCDRPGRLALLVGDMVTGVCRI